MAEIKKIATREAYGAALVEMGKKREDFIVMDADLAAATKSGAFKKAFPERFYDCGIAEQNMVSIAAGIAAAGISVGEDGATHQCCEDIALMRTIPGMTIINPADYTEAMKAVEAAFEHDGPVYMRFGRLAVPVVFDDDYKFEIGKGVELKEGNDVTIVATGLMVNEALQAYETLKAEGINARIINIATIKPLDTEIILKAAKETGAIVTAEEHNIIGGLGSAVSEYLSEACPVPVLKVGVKDTFGKSGPANELLDIFGLRAKDIVQKAKEAVALKK